MTKLLAYYFLRHGVYWNAEKTSGYRQNFFLILEILLTTTTIISRSAATTTTAMIICVKFAIHNTTNSV